MSQPPLKPLEIEDLLNQYKSDQRKLEYQMHKLQGIIQELERQSAEVQEALSFENPKALPSAEMPSAAPAAESKPEKTGKRPGRPRTKKAAKDAAPEATKEPETKEPETKEAESKKPAAKSTAKKRTGKKGAAGKKRGPGRPRKSDEEKESAKAAKKDAAGKEDTGYRLSEWDQFVIDSLKTKQQALITNDFLEIAKGNPDIKSGEAQIKVKLNRSLHKLSNKKGALVKVEHSGRGYAYALADWVNAKGELPKKFAR
ncbi:MAG: hypothetical protein H6557_24895 [Lewinellaceae bacterium]|nr:hypothetical protein [Phaeodactylibacter sp.]MCB9039870.1 hypothetical protein [Lewinellaceae bacterium]